MYKPLEIRAESLLKKASKRDAPAWVIRYAKYRIDKAKHYRTEADLPSIKQLGARSDRFGKAVFSIGVAIEVLEAFVYDGARA